MFTPLKETIEITKTLHGVKTSQNHLGDTVNLRVLGRVAMAPAGASNGSLLVYLLSDSY